MIVAAPSRRGKVSGSCSNHADSRVTLTTSRCDAAKAGPMGACRSKVIQVKKAPM